MRIFNICNRIIEYSFYALFFFVPLALASDTSELFEFNKMWLTFALTIIIAASWIIKMIVQRQIFIQRTPLDIPIALFLISQVISTIFSWDTHISIWGYYSRFNGGLLSIITYIFLYYAFLSNFKIQQARGGAPGAQTKGRARLLDKRGLAPDSAHAFGSEGETSGAFESGGKGATGPRATSAITMVKRSLFVSLLSGLVVALWGLPSHFGYDPTCYLFRGTLDVSCWTADFQPKIRIFSTLGQPSWLAAYLAILIPISIALAIQKTQNTRNVRRVGKSEKSDNLGLRTSDTLIHRVFRVFWNRQTLFSILFFIFSILFYLALLYTRARSGVLATWLSLGFFFIIYFWMQRREIFKSSKFKVPHFAKASRGRQSSKLLVVFVVLVLITFFVGQPFSQLEKFTFEGIKKSITSSQPNESAPSKDPKPQRFAGELGGTDSGTIRKIVWRGALDAWRNYPIFGTGVETFAFAYYRFRPVEHNLTSEWNFLYNKAHNEYLNYLATTGAFGLGSYILMIGWFFFLSLKQFKIQNSKFKMTIQNSKLEKNKLLTLNSNFSLLTLNFALLAAYISILITNFFGFSVVITNIYLFMVPAFVFILGEMINPKKQLVFPSVESGIMNHESRIITRISLYQWTYIFFIILASFFLILNLLRYWNADKAYALGSNLNRAGEYQSAYPKLVEAVEKRPGEPVFKDQLAINNAVIAAALLGQEDLPAGRQEKTETSTDTVALANQLAQNAIELNNSIISDYPRNITFWKSRVRIFYALGQVDLSYLSQALEAVKTAAELAPTDANISYNLGVLYGQNGDTENGIKTLENTIRLKPDYRDAHYALGLFYHDQAVDDNGSVVDRDKLDKAISRLQFILDNLGEDDRIAQETLEQWEKL